MTEPKTEIITCLSVQQPYVDDIFFDGKWCENRSWKTRFRGELWIHSSKIAKTVVAERDQLGCDSLNNSPTGLLTGHILGRVNLVECVTADDLFSAASLEACKAMTQKPEDRLPVTDTNRDMVAFLQRLLDGIDPETWNHFYFQEYAWILGEPEMLEEPIPTGGKLGLWKFEVPTARLKMARKSKRKWTLPAPISATPL